MSPGHVDRPPDLVNELRAMKARLHELERSAPRLPVVAAVVSAVQSIPSGSHTEVEFAVAEIDNRGVWDPGTPTVLTVPYSAVYLVSCHARFDTSTAGERQVQVLVSGAAALGANGPAENLAWQAAPSAPIVLSEGNTLTMSVFQNTGSPLDLDIGRLGLTWLGKQRGAT